MIPTVKLRAAAAAGAVLIGLLFLPASAAGATARTHYSNSRSYDCSGGEIAPGTYGSMTITGVCFATAGNVDVIGDLTVAPGALFDDVTAGDPTTGTPVVSATVDVGGNVLVDSGGALLLGCSPNITCPTGITYDRVGGNLTAIDSQGVVVHSTAIAGNVSVLGGGGGPAAETCNAQEPGTATLTDLEPWSEDPTLDYTPVFTDFEDDSIGGSLDVSGLTSCWMGSFRNEIGGNATFDGNTMGDPDAMELDNNLVAGNMTCLDDETPPQFGDSGAAPNVVGGEALGGCSFQATPLNPAPEADEGPGIPEHIAVPARSLKTYRGVYSSTEEASLNLGTTESGDTIFADLDDFAIEGSGLQGTGTYDPSEPPGSSGEAFLATAYPDRTVEFTVYDICECSFGGETGTISIRAYGTTYPDGLTTGTFLVNSGGGSAPGSLTTLAGYGTFSNFGEPPGTIQLTEHLAIT